MTKQVLSGKIALVTGASRGIGAAVSKALAKSGAHVILVARTVGGLEQVDDEIRQEGGTATLLPCDLSRLDDLDALGPTLAGRFGGLDIFIGNAAMLGTLSPLPHCDAREWDKVMTVNMTANFRLIRTLDPLLRASEAGRAVFTTSGLAVKPMAYWGSYCASKAALSMMVQVYAAEIAKTKIRANLVDPGVVGTALLEKAFPGGYPGHTLKPEDVVDTYLALVEPACEKNGEIIAVPYQS